MNKEVVMLIASGSNVIIELTDADDSVDLRVPLPSQRPD